MHEVPASAMRPRPSFSPGYQPVNPGRQQAPPTEDETWTVEELTLLSMIHRRDHKILDLKRENRRLETISMQREHQIQEITARVKDLEGKFEELKQKEVRCFPPNADEQPQEQDRRFDLGTKPHYDRTDEVFEEVGR